MRLGFIIPTYPDEKRVAILPKDLKKIKDEVVLEHGFGKNLDIEDSAYSGCEFLSREEIFKTCDSIFSLKLIQEEDYQYLRKGQMILGWIHPIGSGRDFLESVGWEKKLKIVDLDNISPTCFYGNKTVPIDFLRRDFFQKNSMNAGIASSMHALISMGFLPNSNTRVAILSSGNVAQGAFSFFAKFNSEITMYYRKTMNEFKEKIGSFDIIVNGIEIDKAANPILTYDDLSKVKKGALIIDSAADAGNAIEGTRFTSMDEPIYIKNDVYFYVINNAPSILYRQSSKDISEALTSSVLNRKIEDYAKIFETLE